MRTIKHEVEAEYDELPWAPNEWQNRPGVDFWRKNWENAEREIKRLNSTLPDTVRIPVRKIESSIIVAYSYCREPFNLKSAVITWNDEDEEGDSYLEDVRGKEWSLLEEEGRRDHTDPEEAIGAEVSEELKLATHARINLTRQIDLVREVKQQVILQRRLSPRPAIHHHSIEHADTDDHGRDPSTADTSATN